MRSIQTTPRRSGRKVKSWWGNPFSSLRCKQRTVPARMEWRNGMIEQTDLAGNFTLPSTSITVNRMGYGAMQLAGRDGNKLVWGPPRDIDGAIALLREVVARGVNHIDT